jgi:diguanylate cyclase (GGDEF)-like protein
VDRADAALAGRTRQGSLAALFLDLDDFKTVNDSLGHAAGDELLVKVAERIRAELRETDLAARLGGDEFGILLLDIPDASYAVTVSKRLLAALDAQMEVAGAHVDVGASIGIAVDLPSMTNVDDLLGDADIAMYQAKAKGKGRHQVFAPEIAASTRTDAATVSAGRRSWIGRAPHVRRGASAPRLEPEAG